MSFRVEFTLDIAAFSVNKMTYRDVRFKTAEYKDWATAVLQMLSEEKDLVDMAARFDDTKDAFLVEVCVEYPKHVFYNKAGSISSKTVDCTNVGKPLIDLIFRDTMGINDKHITRYVESKRVGARNQIKVVLALIPLKD
jgi:hypothetical protein